MPQHDLDIANQSAPNFRSDLNDALEALGTLSSGAAAPSTTYANMLWYDTANNILKMRSEADDAWINLFNLNQGTGTSFPSNIPTVIDEDSFTTNSATRPPSQQSTKAYVDAGDEKQLGIGQTWQDVTASRADGVSYRNTTGKPIEVAINGVSGGATNFEVSTNNSTWIRIAESSSSTADSRGHTHFNHTIPNLLYYRYNGNFGDIIWAELR